MGHHVSIAYRHKNKASKDSKGKVVDEKATLKRCGYDIDWKGNIGEGSYAKVKRGFSHKLNRAVAVKIINETSTADSYTNKFCPRELSILDKLSHPNIVCCEEIIQVDKKVFIVMELATQGDLLDYVLRKESLPESDARHIFNPLVSAISYLHNLNILHRDLKCENILLYDGLIPKLTDFGFSKCMENRHKLSRTFCGSAGYAAFEVLKGLPYDGVKSDVWSLGVILHVMVFGTMPFNDSNRKTQLEDMERGLRLCTRYDKKISESLKDLLENTMNINVKLRLSTDDITRHAWAAGKQTLDSTDCGKVKLYDLVSH